MTTLYVQSPTLYLSGSGVIIGAVTASLTSLTDIYGNVLTMADFGDIGYITFEPDTTNAEAGTFTGITANANGTYTLTGVKTILAKLPYTQTSGLVRNHAGGTKVVITDNVGFWNTFVNKNNNSTIVGKLTMPDGANRPVLTADTDTATTTAVVTYGQLQRTAIAGATAASTSVLGIVRLSSTPSVATSPIVVETADIRVPTANPTTLFAPLATAVPTGSVIPFAGSSAPTSWLLCDGSAVSRATYATLFALISTTYGVGDGSTTFNVPNLKGKVAVGYNSSETEFDTLGETGGAKTHTLDVTEIPSHTHMQNVYTTGSGITGPQIAGGAASATPGDYQVTDATGGGLAHNNLQPYITLNYIIKI